MAASRQPGSGDAPLGVAAHGKPGTGSQRGQKFGPRETRCRSSVTGRLIEVLDQALDALLERCMKRKVGARSRKAAARSDVPRRAGEPTALGRVNGASDAVDLQSAGEPVAASPAASGSGAAEPTAAVEPVAVAHAPGPVPGKNRTRHISNATKSEVVTRDGLACSFVGPTGRRCGATAFLEFHHVEPFARGGTHGVENVRLYCRAHNGYAAEQD